MERKQMLQRGRGVYAERCCRLSYGVVCREIYDPIRHIGEKAVVDPLDKKKWAEEQIDWLIKEVGAAQRGLLQVLNMLQGEVVPRDGIRRPYKLKIPFGQEHEIWRAQIVMCEDPASELPRSMRSSSVRPVCVVQSKFKDTDFNAGEKSRKGRPSFQIKNKSLFKSRPQYHLAEFDVAVIVGPTDLKFRLLSKDGTANFSREHEEIEVNWQPAQATTDIGESMSGMYRSET